MRLIVSGSRSFNDYSLMERKLDRILENVTEPIEIVCGECRGADKLGKRYAKAHGYPVKSFPADWGKYKKKAGYIRNKEMAQYATHCVCFWDGISPGTILMLDLAAEYKLKVRLIYF